MGFQALLSMLIIYAIVKLFIQWHRKHINVLFFISFLSIWVGVFFLNLNNIVVQNIGRILGINDGARVFVYVALFSLFYYAVTSRVKFYEIEKDIDFLIKKDAVYNFSRKYKLKD